MAEDHLVAKKLCNCLIADAEADLSVYSLATRLLGVEAATPAVEAVLRGFKAAYGGLWVGGSVELTTRPLTFHPNAVNRVMHKGDYSFSVPLADISSASYERGFVTGIIVVATPRARFKLRCWAARRFLAVIDCTRSSGLI